MLNFRDFLVWKSENISYSYQRIQTEIKWFDFVNIVHFWICKSILDVSVMPGDYICMYHRQPGLPGPLRGFGYFMTLHNPHPSGLYFPGLLILRELSIFWRICWICFSYRFASGASSSKTQVSSGTPAIVDTPGSIPMIESCISAVPTFTCFFGAPPFSTITDSTAIHGEHLTF